MRVAHIYLTSYIGGTFERMGYIMNENTLFSLAILKVDLDEGDRDYIAYLEKFVINVLNKHRPDPVTDAPIAELLLSESGLRIPIRGVQLVLRRLAKRGFLKRSNHVYSITDKLPVSDLDEKRRIAERHINRIYAALKGYVKESFDVTWSDENCTHALLSFLKNFSVDCLRAYIFGTSIPDIPRSAPEDQFLVSKFITCIYESDGELFDSVIVLVKGQMYSNAIQCPDLESIEKNFKSLSFFLDTPLVLNVLGLQGEEEYAASSELLALLKNLKGKLFIFSHTLDEIRDVIASAIRNIDNPRAHGKVITEIRKSGMKLGDLTILQGRIEEELEGLGIKIYQTPRYKEDLQIDEMALESAIDSEIHYISPRAMENDVNSIRSIYVLRSGKVPRRLEDAEAVLVTTNAALARAAYELGKSHNSSREVSSVISDYSLANVAWLKAPLGAPDLPAKEAIATCYAAMEPTRPLWEKYILELDRMLKDGKINPDDHAILRVSSVAVDELMNLTMGAEEALTSTSIRAIVDRVHENIAREHDVKLKAEQERHNQTKHEKEIVEGQNEHALQKLYWLSRSVSGALYWLLLCFIAIVLLVAAGLSAPITSTWLTTSQLTGFSLNFVVIVAAIWGVLSTLTSYTIPDLLHRFRIFIEGKLYKKLQKHFFEE